MKYIIGIVGRIHSGKSTLAGVLSEDMHMPIVSFGGYLKNFSINNNLPIDRDSLQNLGNSRIHENVELFVKDVLDSAENVDLIIVEGIRHRLVFNRLKEIYSKSFFIFLDVPFDERYQRYRTGKTEYKNLTVQDFYNLDNHEVELEIDDLMELCDLKLNADYSISELKNKISIY